jgi:YebC/PmpR family DNA-binding regulatory protein
MAGHSKWANIQHRKGKQDAKRGKLFTKLIREITVAARMGGEDLNSNPRLRAAVVTARTGNMTADTIDRAIKRGAGTGEAENIEEIRYEGYGPGGVAVIVDCMTDNRNRTVGEVRHAFSKCGGNLGQAGSVAYLFNKIGQLCFAPPVDEDKIMEIALESGAQDIINNDDDSCEVITTPEEFGVIQEALQTAKLIPVSAEVTWMPTTQAAISGDDAESVLKLIDMLEDLDDVQKVYTNADISTEALEAHE